MFSVSIGDILESREGDAFVPQFSDKLIRLCLLSDGAAGSV